MANLSFVRRRRDAPPRSVLLASVHNALNGRENESTEEERAKGAGEGVSSSERGRGEGEGFFSRKDPRTEVAQGRRTLGGWARGV